MILFILLTVVGVSSAEFCLSGGVLDTLVTPHKCLYFVLAPLSYDDANMVCLGVAGTLTSIASAFEQSLIVGQSHDKPQLDDYWIGLTNQLDPSQWQWDDGSSLSFTNWMNDPSTNDPTDNNCVAARLGTGKWYNIDCDTNLRNFLCKADTIDIAPGSSETYHCTAPTSDGRPFGKCYLPLNAEIAYKKAEMVCASFDGDLVSINNSTEMAVVVGSGRSALINQKEYWIGLNNFFDGYNWAWTGDTDSSYRNWAGSPPGNVSTEEGCVSASVRTGKWQNKLCATTFAFICELPITEMSPTLQSTYPTCPPAQACPTCPPPQTCPTLRPAKSCPTCPSTQTCPTSSSRGSCPSDGEWLYFPKTNSCYQVIKHNGTGSLYDVLEQRCVALGGHLASIHSIEEEHLVNEFGCTFFNRTNFIAIGYRSSTDIHSFEWTDGSPNDYVDWHSLPIAGLLCAYMYEGYSGFLSDNCRNSNEFAGVCKKPAN